MAVQDIVLSEPAAFRAADKIVIDATTSKVRTFLYEIAEGTSNYRSLHSLTEQVEPMQRAVAPDLPAPI